MEYCCYRIIDNILQVRIFRSNAERLEFIRRNKGYKVVDSVLITKHKRGDLFNGWIFKSPNR